MKEIRRSKVALAILVGLALFLAGSVLAAAQAVDLVFLVDESGSLCNSGPSPHPPGNVAVEVDGFISALDNVVVPWVAAGGTARIAVVSFGTGVTTRIELTDVATNEAAIVAALNAIKTSPNCGSTNLGGAVNEAKAILDGGTAPLGIMNLATDGSPTAGPPFQEACSNARDAGYQVWALGIGESVDQAALEACVGGPARYFYAPTVADFAAVEEEKLRQIISSPTPEPEPTPGEWQTGITADYKRVLADEALDLKADIGDLIASLRTEVVGDMVGDKLLLCTKYWIIRARREIEEGGNAVTVQDKLQSAQTCKQSAYAGFPTVQDIMDDLEESIIELSLDIDSHIASRDIGKADAEDLNKIYLAFLLERLTEKRVLLIEMDRELEIVDEYLVEAEAFIKEDNWRDAKGAIKKAEREIKKVIGKVWEFKENMKYIMGYTQGFIRAVLNAPLMPPPEAPPYYPGHLAVGSGLSVIPSNGSIRFAVMETGIEALRVEVFGLGGGLVFNSGFVARNTFEWHLMNSYGDVVANGVYLYVVTVRGWDGSATRSEVRKLAVLR